MDLSVAARPRTVTTEQTQQRAAKEGGYHSPLVAPAR